MISGNTFQNIYEEINKYLMPDWEKLVIYLEYGVASYSFEFYVKVNGTFIKCFDLPGVSEDELLDSFAVIDKMVSAEREQALDDNWTNMTMVILPSGKMKSDFDYTDLTEGAYQYTKAWKDKYLV